MRFRLPPSNLDLNVEPGTWNRIQRFSNSPNTAGSLVGSFLKQREATLSTSAGLTVSLQLQTCL